MYVSSVRLLTAAFDAGYLGLDTLRKAIGSRSETAERDTITDFLTRVKPVLTLPAPDKAKYATSKNLREAERNTAIDSQTIKNIQLPTPVLNRVPRPASDLNGARRVPSLAAATRIAFLRLTKPQPESLSGFLKHKIAVDRKRLAQKDQLALCVLAAEREDEWEALMVEHKFQDKCHLDTENGKPRSSAKATNFPYVEPKWATEAYKAWAHVFWVMGKDNLKTGRKAWRMQAIVDGEQALADEEQAPLRARDEKAAVAGKWNDRDGTKRHDLARPINKTGKTAASRGTGEIVPGPRSRTRKPR